VALEDGSIDGPKLGHSEGMILGPSEGSTGVPLLVITDGTLLGIEPTDGSKVGQFEGSTLGTQEGSLKGP
jgi:hypothetical protein